MWTVAQLAGDLAAGRTTSRRLTEQALERIADPAGEGKRAFLKPYAEAALAEADFSDRLRKGGVRRSPVDGLPVSLKDLYDVAGDVTRAGSKILNQKAEKDAAAVARLRAAGAVFVGRTNMVEFAFGTTGINPHYGTPKNPWDRKTGRIPGGSSSGAAVAQADGMCVMALGSDTRGSIRIPSAFCGITGFKPTTRRVPREGAFPLSYTLDSVGPLANSVACCAVYDSILAGEPPEPLPELTAKGLRFLVPKTEVREGLDGEVASAFQSALDKLARAGAVITEKPVPAFDRQAEYFKGGGYAGAEAYAIHRKNAGRLAEYDPRVAKRVLLAKDLSAADYVDFGLLRAEFQREIEAITAPFDAFLLPTVPCIAPPIAEVDASDEAYFRWNMRILR
ncbi:MAG TPA: amidase, partial [Burkholderiales bacterium]|nr:amidase [Burkholderiales bacterium]